MADPAKIRMPPITTGTLKVVRYKRKLNITTKKGYDISMMAAVGALRYLTPDKIRISAMMVKRVVTTMSAMLVLLS